MEQFTNRVTLRGSLAALPEFSHENHGTRFFRFSLAVPRLSGAVDVLPVVTRESLLNTMDLSAGEMITVTGQLRSHNLFVEDRRRLLIFVYAVELVCEDGQPINDVCLEGVLCREPTYRRTPLGREICDVMLAVKRAYNRSDYLPCILWGTTARQTAQCGVGDSLAVTGRLQSREYTKLTPEGAENRTTYELSSLTARILPSEKVHASL